jgi:hypothetical protein
MKTSQSYGPVRSYIRHVRSVIIAKWKINVLQVYA